MSYFDCPVPYNENIHKRINQNCFSGKIINDPVINKTLSNICQVSKLR